MEDAMIVAISWCGALTLLWLILAISMCVLWNKVTRLSRAPHHYPGIPIERNPHAKTPSVYSYGSPAIEPGEDLARRGYAKHNPRTPQMDAPDNRYPNNPQANRDDMGGAYFADDFAPPPAPKARKSQPPAKKPTSLDVPHFFNQQMGPNGAGRNQPSGNDPRSPTRSQGMTNPNFQY